ncbi:MAG: hypothetical protein IVW53_05525 [Chloroflexi bacterium]|nr:hypothetical protein [Chloroflexota bacterium]
MSRHAHRHVDRARPHPRSHRVEAARPSETGGAPTAAVVARPPLAAVVLDDGSSVQRPAAESTKASGPERGPEPLPDPVSRADPPPPTDPAPSADVPPADTSAPGSVEQIHQSTCTTAQLRRFVKSRAYLPMHEIRRRFAIDGGDDDVTAVIVDGSCIYLGLPDREGRMLGELLAAGEVGFELSHDPVTPIVVGVFPMRPIPRS